MILIFKQFASDALGISDIGQFVPPNQYNQTDSDDYVFHEDGEKIVWVIRSKSDEYCFTNKALIHLDGTSAVSKKRTLHRYSYAHNPIRNTKLETAGLADLDVEIHFTMGSKNFSIDVHKQHIEALKDLYKALTAIEELSRKNEQTLAFSQQSVNLAVSALSRISPNSGDVAANLEKTNEYIFDWFVKNAQKHQVRDFSFVFEKYINN